MPSVNSILSRFLKSAGAFIVSEATFSEQLESLKTSTVSPIFKKSSNFPLINAYNKIYDNPNSFGDIYGKHREFLEFDEEQHYELKEYATARNITYFCTPCDITSLELMERIGTPFYKVASRDLTNIPLLEAMGKLGKPVIISTGASKLEEIEK